MYIFEAKGDTRSTTTGIDCDCSRTIFTDKNNLPLNNGDHKIHEKITFNDVCNINFPLVIGLNPAKGDKDKFDLTNRYLAKYFKNKVCGGYLLYNAYTVVQPNKSELIKYIKSNPDDIINNFQDTLVKIILSTTCDIYIFWGKKCSEKRLINNAVLIRLIKTLYSSRKIYYSFKKTDKNKEFVHPACAKNNLDFAQINAENINLIF